MINTVALEMEDVSKRIFVASLDALRGSSTHVAGATRK